jgi:hypothetical protein
MTKVELISDVQTFLDYLTSDEINVLDANFVSDEVVQPRSQGFRMRTRRDTRKPWSGPVNFAF